MQDLQQVAVHFPSLCFAMSCVVVGSKEAPVFTITQRCLCVYDFPFCRVDLVKCESLFELSYNATREEKDAEVKCYPSKRPVGNLDCQVKRTSAESGTKKLDSSPLPELDWNTTTNLPILPPFSIAV